MKTTLVPSPISSKTTVEPYATFTYHKFEDGSIVTEVNAPHLSKPHFYSYEPYWTAAKAYLNNWDWSPEIKKEMFNDYQKDMDLIHRVAARIS